MSPLWSIDALAAAVGGRLAGAPAGPVTGISIDSRTVAPGEAFFAIRGDRFDGHDFVGAALEAGAGLAVVATGRAARVPSGVGPLIVVNDDPLDALARLAAAARARSGAGIVAVTGSVGKTGTKEMLRTALSAIGPAHAPVGSFNNQWGVPLTLARMPADAAFGVFEIGMNHAGEITPLTRLVRPHVAIVTTVASAHREYFASVEEIAEAKAEIFLGLEPGGTAVLNRDNEWFGLLARRAGAAGASVLSFGEEAAADVRLERVSLAEDRCCINADIAGHKATYRLGAPGRHMAVNSLAVLAAAHALGVDLARAALALDRFRPLPGRGVRHRLRHQGGPFTVIDESYNANPASVRAALAVLGNAEPGRRGRRVAVLGDMLELGDVAAADHAGLLEPLREAGVDLVLLAGPLMKTLWQVLPDRCRGAYAEDAAELEPILLKTARPGDVIMIKASAGTRLGPLVDALRRRFESGDEPAEADMPIAPGAPC